ncbi:MAG: DUF3263 domain-containing protein [Actinomycetota bacterium]|nr:MAG: DUF3263 domain-containing protein [Actinomycetota bacterium]
MRSSGAGSSGLTDRHRAMLELERYAPVLASPKSEHIRTIFRLSPRRYHQLLDVLIDQPAALQYDPLVVKRLRRERARRRTQHTRELLGS